MTARDRYYYVYSCIQLYCILQLWCAKKAIYIQLWPLGTIKVEKYVN